MTDATFRSDLGYGVSMPMAGLGTWQLRGRQGQAAIRYAPPAACRQIDTDTMYRNEAEVCRAIRDSGLTRDEVLSSQQIPARVSRLPNSMITKDSHAIAI